MRYFLQKSWAPQDAGSAAVRQSSGAQCFAVPFVVQPCYKPYVVSPHFAQYPALEKSVLRAVSIFFAHLERRCISFDAVRSTLFADAIVSVVNCPRCEIVLMLPEL